MVLPFICQIQWWQIRPNLIKLIDQTIEEAHKIELKTDVYLPR